MPLDGYDIRRWLTWPSLGRARAFGSGFLVALILLSGLVAAGSQIEPPRTGLLWHQSGLPATFPLQVKTVPGQDYHLTLIETATQNAVLAAYIEGGDFFRVLVPPGEFILRFEYGTTWQGEEARFGTGPETDAFVLDMPLRFAIEGVNRKAGHLVDLRTLFQPGAVVDVSPDAICQSIAVTLEPSPSFRDLPEDAYEFPGSDISDDPLDAARERVQNAPPRVVRRTEVRARICD